MRIREITESVGELKLYHVTPASNIKSIMKKGLLPRVGERSAQLGERKAVFLFPTMEDAEEAVGNWLGDEFDDEENLALLEITLDSDDENLLKEEDDDSVAGYECIYLAVIPPSKIKVITEEF